MAAEISPITDGNQPESLTDREMIEDIHQRLARIETNLTALLSAWAGGGLRGLRAAARGTHHGR